MPKKSEAIALGQDAINAVAARKLMGRVDPSSRYGLLFLMLIITFACSGSLTTGKWSEVIVLLAESATLMVALVATGSRRVTFIWVSIIVGFGMITGITNAATGISNLSKATAVISILLILMAPFLVIRAVIERRVVDLQTVMAALCLYVMLGLFFTFLFAGLQSISGHSFFAQTGRGSTTDFLYYSFATMTTVGYGDLTASMPTGRTLSVTEAMIGQLYLVTVVAVLVSNLRPQSKAAKAKASREAASDEDH